MTRKFIAFDIETAREIPGVDFDWKPHRPLGITCIASQATEDATPKIWLSRTDAGTPAAQMSRSDVAAFVRHLHDSLQRGYLPLSWNGLGFDLDVIAEESGLHVECRELARRHVDMMFHIVCEKGFPVALKNAATGLGVSGKRGGVEGINAPGLWASGQFEVVTDYVAQDVRATLAIALESERRELFAWKTRRGTISNMPLARGWLTVDEACQLPLPDTSWMSNPIERSSYLDWLSDSAGIRR